jgi:hypothetical protein
MVGKKKMGKASRSGQNTTSHSESSGPGIGDTSYFGPLTIAATPREDYVSLQRLTNVVNLTFSTSPGAFAFPNDPSGSGEWSLFAGQWQEYRVLAHKLRFIPFLKNFNNAPSSANLYGPMVWIIERDAGAALPTSMSAAFQSESAKIASVQDRMTIGVKAGSSQEMLFNPVRTTGGSWKVVVNQDSLTPLTIYVLVYQEFLVQIRNRA